MIKLLLIIEALIALAMGAVVFLNSPYSKLHRSYALVSLFSAVWLLSNSLSISDTPTGSINSFAGQLITPASLLTTFCLALFLKQLGRRVFFGATALWSLLAPNIVISSLAFTRWNTYVGNDNKLHVGPLYPIFVVVLVANILMALTLLFSRTPRIATPSLRSQLSFMRYGLALAVIPAALFGAVLPLFGFDSLSNASPLFAIIFLLLTALSIVRHNLFDIRLIVARSFVYSGLIATIGMMYAFIVQVVFAHLFEKNHLSRNEQLAYLMASLAIGFTFAPLKKFFDRWSRKIFYHDSYEPQQLLDQLNRSLLKEINLKALLDKSSLVIRENINAEFVNFGILTENKADFRFFGAGEFNLRPAELDVLKHSFKSGRRVLSLGDLEDQASRVYGVLREHAIMAIGQLSTRSNHMGYIFLGNKKTGSLYSRQDLQIIQLIADELAIAVQNSLHVEEIERFNITLQEKVDDATRQLRHANQRLKELDQTKDEFISMASHQLRTPLTTIKGYLSMVLEGDIGPVTKDERKMIQQAFDSSERMVFLIADLLNVSRLQSGKFVIENKPTDMAKMVDDQVNQLKDTAANHHLTLEFKKPDKFPILNLDETKIQQVVMNFMDNAIYYTPAGGNIEVALEATDKEVRYTVTDTGLGVPKAEQHHLFAKFYRAGNARKMRPDGTGLGLFMAKKVIVAQGGAIIFKSTEGKGSTFGFSFPRAKVEVRTATSAAPGVKS